MIQKRYLVSVTCSIALSVVANVSAAEGWVDLFNGKDLAGWTQRGGVARYSVDGEAIVGASVVNTGNSFLCTAKEYGDFILEYEFKVDSRLNSGVQIRSECFDVPKTIDWEGRQIHVAAGRVHGYQVEIDPNVDRGRLWSGGIFDESRRGWLYPNDGVEGAQGKAFSKQGVKIFKANDWNHVRVEAIGDSIKTWLNGIPCADIRDGLTSRGFIALQVHQIKADQSRAGAEVRWRHLRIQELGDPAPANTLTDADKAEGWRLLWDGKSVDGWRSLRAGASPEKCWDIADGILTVHPAEGPEGAGGGSIISRERFSNFELVADFNVAAGANSGIKYFVQSDLERGAGAGVGCEFQILDDTLHPDARLGRNGNRTVGALYDLFPPAANKKVNPAGQWNTARVVVKGKHVEHWLNGEMVVEYERGSPEFRAAVAGSKFKNIPGFAEWPDGHILLQEHGDRVQFRNIKIRVLPAS